MADRDQYPHIQVRRLGVASVNFRAPGGGKTERIPPIDNRPAHAHSLMQGLTSAREHFRDYADAQKEVGVKLSRRGIPVTVEGRPDVPLKVGKGRTNVLNVQRADPNRKTPEAENVDRATFFLTKGMLDTLQRNLETYGQYVEPSDFQDRQNNRDEEDEEEELPGRPRNFSLFETGGHIRPTTIRDLWTDRIEALPRKKNVQTNWEVWSRLSRQDWFENALAAFDVRSIGRATTFVDTAVHNLVATPAEIMEIVRASGAIVQLRGASSFASDYLQMVPERRAKTVASLVDRIEDPPVDAPRVAVLDTGVLRAHPLLRSALPANRCFAADDRWTVDDHHGHGTKMAGIVQFGDLADIAPGSSPIPVMTRLESVVVTAPDGAPPLPARDAIRRAVVDLIETAKHKRVYCLAQTAVGEFEDGRPTSTSAVLDQLAFNDGTNTRLFCAAVGNAPHTEEKPYQVGDYSVWNRDYGVQAPAQALNALSVGAVSLKNLSLPGVDLVAQPGNLAPSSRTAERWPARTDPEKSDIIPTKPDIVMEGGNFRVDPDGVFCRPSPRHLVMTTSRGAPSSPLAMVGETSAATAAAAGLSGRLLARYPKLRMESLRALLVHSAEWTPQMLEHFEDAQTNRMSDIAARRLLFSRFGWGTPNEERLFHSAANALTLIAEDTITPYREKEGDSTLRLKEMKYFELPWPVAALRALGETVVDMRCTLSFFVDPDPQASARDRLESYPSHRLKFDVRRFGESHAQTKTRSNRLADQPDFRVPSDDTNWMLGLYARQRGSLHQDDWHGPAYELAQRNGICVAPVRGWWGDSKTFGKAEKAVRFSLVVSIRTPENSPGDLVAETLTHIPAGKLIGVAEV